MTVSKQAKRDAKELFLCCRLNGLMDEDRVRKTVSALLDRRPRGYLGILAYFKRLVRFEIERRTARIQSPQILPPGLQETIQAALTRTHGPGLYTSVEQNPALIGGLRIQVGSDVYDGSIQARLSALEASFEQEGT
jgi:F-type H+-transporting ATPase subunit delta